MRSASWAMTRFWSRQVAQAPSSTMPRTTHAAATPDQYCTSQVLTLSPSGRRMSHLTSLAGAHGLGGCDRVHGGGGLALGQALLDGLEAALMGELLLGVVQGAHLALAAAADRLAGQVQHLGGRLGAAGLPVGHGGVVQAQDGGQLLLRQVLLGAPGAQLATVHAFTSAACLSHIG